MSESTTQFYFAMPITAAQEAWIDLHLVQGEPHPEVAKLAASFAHTVREIMEGGTLGFRTAARKRLLEFAASASPPLQFAALLRCMLRATNDTRRFGFTYACAIDKDDPDAYTGGAVVFAADELYEIDATAWLRDQLAQPLPDQSLGRFRRLTADFPDSADIVPRFTAPMEMDASDPSVRLDSFSVATNEGGTRYVSMNVSLVRADQAEGADGEETGDEEADDEEAE